jgi:hypothetical protein
LSSLNFVEKPGSHVEFIDISSCGGMFRDDRRPVVGNLRDGKTEINKAVNIRPETREVCTSNIRSAFDKIYFLSSTVSNVKFVSG